MSQALDRFKVLVTPRSYGSNDSDLYSYLESRVGEVIYNDRGRPLSSAELMKIIPDCDGYIAGLDEITGDVLRSANKLQVIARYGVGIDNIDLDTAKKLGIVVTNTPEANSISVAELTVGLIITLARNIPAAYEETKNGQWPRINGLSLEGKSVGLLGFGSIGKQVAVLLSGFYCKLLAYDPAFDYQFAKVLGVQYRSVNDLIREADFLSLHVPLHEETQDLIDEKFLERMKKGSFLINTSRGEIVDEAALIKALEENYLKGAALDVLRNKPPNTSNPLLKRRNVIVTPHIGAHTDGATNAMGWGALKDCLAVLCGEQPLNRVI